MAHDQSDDALLLAVDSLETSALTKAQLAELLFEQIGLNKREAKDMVDAFYALIVEHLIAGDDVKLSGFGNFQMRVKAPRPGRNPRTGELIPIAARRVVTFHASQKLKDQLQAAAEVTGRRDDTT
ncbi:MAG TPA: integration host factor subunit alpha [Ottowia sp.]|jgi:integration host factor subunit alpha|nr:MAG: integration host factor subunit alpha [Burkholderiales bacterium 68-10]HMT16971.1 integration host factor subunit alpha [Ottowia sp.]HMT58172.1 integration host factor subunit alpha [Ottowia sp.]HMT84023.1 integration host factor subunit alpha [Ottowia sp.]HOK10971.1 integration host factor subunit alpha [Ottowia sp.]